MQKTHGPGQFLAQDAKIFSLRISTFPKVGRQNSNPMLHWLEANSASRRHLQCAGCPWGRNLHVWSSTQARGKGEADADSCKATQAPTGQEVETPFKASGTRCRWLPSMLLKNATFTSCVVVFSDCDLTPWTLTLLTLHCERKQICKQVQNSILPIFSKQWWCNMNWNKIDR